MENFLDNMVIGDATIALYKSQKNHMSIVLNRVLKTTDGMRLNRKHRNYPPEIWTLHEKHQRSSATNQTITTALSQELAKMKVVDFDYSTKCLDVFDTALEKFNEISPNAVGMAISFLKSATYDNSDLVSAWATCETICKIISAGSVPTYDQYFEYILDHAKKLEVTVLEYKQ